VTQSDSAVREADALAVTVVRAIETEDRNAAQWSDADRAWVSQAAAAEVGESAPPARFVAARARLALARLQERFPTLQHGLATLAWRPWVGTVVVLLAFAAGLLADRMGGSQRINVLAPPVLLLLVWNLLVYLMLLLAPLLRLGRLQLPDVLRSAVATIGAGWRRSRGGRTSATPVAHWLRVVSAEWASIAAPLYQLRATRLLHLGAAVFASGVIAGMYLRGLALEYRASWESTFLDAATVHALLSVVLAPGAWLGQVPVPDLTRVAAIQAPGSENAAAWLHLMALSLLALVVLPRLLLAAIAAWREARQARAFPLALESAYFRRMLRGFHVAPNHAVVLPYGYAPSARAVAGLDGLLQRLLGGAVAIHQVAPTGYGEDAPSGPPEWAAHPGTRVLLFNMAATPEQEAHGAFAAAVVAQSGATEPLLVVVDETSFAARAGDDPQRLAQRRKAWTDLLGTVRVTPAFVNLADPDSATADAALDAALFRPDR
jgi:hypothetical protein